MMLTARKRIGAVMTAAAVMRFIRGTYPQHHMERCEVVVIGAGPAGLATAGALRHYGIGAVVVERDAIGASWRRHYDRLHLHTVRWLSHLPGYRFSRRHGRWVSRDGVIRYLEGYARHHEIELLLETAVERIDKGFVL